MRKERDGGTSVLLVKLVLPLVVAWAEWSLADATGKRNEALEKKVGFVKDMRMWPSQKKWRTLLEGQENENP